jgi:hypothetical protein
MILHIAKAVSAQFGLANLSTELFMLFVLEALGFSALLRFVIAALDIRATRHYWTAIPLAFFIVILGVWARLPTTTSDPTLPNLTINVRASGADLPKLDSTFISVVATVRNDGEATSIGGYPLILTVPKTQPVMASRQTIPLTGIELGGEWLCGQDSLDRHLEQIPRGGQLKGRLLYLIKGVRADAFKAPGTMITLVITDAFGKPWPVTAPVSPPFVKSDIRTIPGFQTQPLEPIRSPQVRTATTPAVQSPCRST